MQKSNLRPTASEADGQASALAEIPFDGHTLVTLKDAARVTLERIATADPLAIAAATELARGVLDLVAWTAMRKWRAA